MIFWTCDPQKPCDPQKRCLFREGEKRLPIPFWWVSTVLPTWGSIALGPHNYSEARLQKAHVARAPRALPDLFGYGIDPAGLDPGDRIWVDLEGIPRLE